MFMEHSNVPGVLYVIAFLQVKNEVETAWQSSHMQNRCEPPRIGDGELFFNMQISGPASAIAEVQQHREPLQL